MKIINNINALQQAINGAISSKKIVGLVPTMGALHAGHIALVKQALAQSDFVVVSIFVNPTQFTESQDYNNYPRTPEADIELLKATGVEVVFLPDFQEIYPKPDTSIYDFGYLETVLEGKFRPGHFKGVAMVVKRFFEVVTPHKAFFGLKDYQQVKVVEKMVEQFNLPVQIIGVPTIREEDGLAMSSRNILLTEHQRSVAPLIYNVLTSIKEKIKHQSVKDALLWGSNIFLNHSDFELEYLDITDSNTLQPINGKESINKAVLLTAVRIGKVRLIDNLELNYE